MSSDPTNTAGPVMTYDEAGHMTLSEVERAGITLVENDREKALIESYRRAVGKATASAQNTQTARADTAAMLSGNRLTSARALAAH